MQIFSKLGALIVTMALVNVSVFAASIDQVINAGVSRADEGASAQKRIVSMAEETDTMLRDYKAAVKTLDGLKIYNNLQKKQIDNQQAEKDNLKQSIATVGDIEKQIVPLMKKMTDELFLFIKEDVPFQMEEREKRIQLLYEGLETPGVSDAEKLRKVLEAYQIEMDYGNSVNSYKQKVEVAAGNVQEVNMLRVGRVSLSYQSQDGQYTAGWDPATKSWVSLSPADYKTQVASGIKMANKEVSPDLFIAPIPAPVEAK